MDDNSPGTPASRFALFQQIPEVGRKLGNMNDRAWLAIILAFGICVVAVLMWRFDVMQREQRVFFEGTLRQNTEALVRAAVALERIERRQ